MNGFTTTALAEQHRMELRQDAARQRFARRVRFTRRTNEERS